MTSAMNILTLALLLAAGTAGANDASRSDYHSIGLGWTLACTAPADAPALGRVQNHTQIVQSWRRNAHLVAPQQPQDVQP